MQEMTGFAQPIGLGALLGVAAALFATGRGEPRGRGPEERLRRHRDRSPAAGDRGGDRSPDPAGRRARQQGLRSRRPGEVGYDNFYCRFSYEDSRDSFNIPHAIRLLEEVFRQEPGGYAQENYDWKSYDVMTMIGGCDEERQRGYRARVDAVKKTYTEMSDVYQESKGAAEIPLD